MTNLQKVMLPLFSSKPEAQKTETPYAVLLCSCGNPDYGQTQPQSIPEVAFVADFKEASSTCRDYIMSNDLGGGNWTGGIVANEDGEPVAYISYNGRVWSPGEYAESHGHPLELSSRLMRISGLGRRPPVEALREC